MDCGPGHVSHSARESLRGAWRFISGPTMHERRYRRLRGLYMAGVDIFKLDIGNALDQLPAWWKTMYAA